MLLVTQDTVFTFQLSLRILFQINVFRGYRRIQRGLVALILRLGVRTVWSKLNDSTLRASYEYWSGVWD